jgi:exportin-2 (importin alpha re-exporter)
VTHFPVDHDIEQFEDDPLEFIRLDLSIPSAGTVGGTSGEAVTRRQAAADVLKALVAGGLEGETTEVVGSLIQKGLETYTSNPRENWRFKDVAVYLLGAIATRGSTVAVRSPCYSSYDRSFTTPPIISQE